MNRDYKSGNTLSKMQVNMLRCHLKLRKHVVCHGSR